VGAGGAVTSGTVVVGAGAGAVVRAEVAGAGALVVVLEEPQPVITIARINKKTRGTNNLFIKQQPPLFTYKK